jgi:hypothetical protein
MVEVYPRAPRFRVKTLNYPDRPGDFGWDGKWYYHFRSDHEWKDMEWVELKSGSSQSSISTDEITAICQRIGFEIERHGDTVRIIGYRKSHS